MHFKFYESLAIFSFKECVRNVLQNIYYTDFKILKLDGIKMMSFIYF